MVHAGIPVGHSPRLHAPGCALSLLCLPPATQTTVSRALLRCLDVWCVLRLRCVIAVMLDQLASHRIVWPAPPRVAHENQRGRNGRRRSAAWSRDQGVKWTNAAAALAPTRHSSSLTCFSHAQDSLDLALLLAARYSSPSPLCLRTRRLRPPPRTSLALAFPLVAVAPRLFAMSSHTKAFGRSLPRDMQEERAAALISSGLGHELSPSPLWKVNDELAGKNGPCQAVYWVKERPVSNDLKRHSASAAADEKKWDTGAVYKGEWKANRKHGYGTQIWSNGNKYEGEWANGNREGHGVFWLREKPTPEQKKKMEEKAHAASLISSSSSSAAAAAKNTGSKKLRRVYAGNWKNDLKDGQWERRDAQSRRRACRVDAAHT